MVVVIDDWDDLTFDEATEAFAESWADGWEDHALGWAKLAAKLWEEEHGE